MAQLTVVNKCVILVERFRLIKNFTFMLPCITINFFLITNQTH